MSTETPEPQIPGGEPVEPEDPNEPNIPGGEPKENGDDDDEKEDD